MTDLCRKSHILTGYLELLIEENLSSEASNSSSKERKQKGLLNIYLPIMLFVYHMQVM